jgi:hypothetical protein
VAEYTVRFRYVYKQGCLRVRYATLYTSIYPLRLPRRKLVTAFSLLRRRWVRILRFLASFLLIETEKLEFIRVDAAVCAFSQHQLFGTSLSFAAKSLYLQYSQPGHGSERRSILIGPKPQHVLPFKWIKHSFPDYV